VVESQGMNPLLTDEGCFESLDIFAIMLLFRTLLYNYNHGYNFYSIFTKHAGIDESDEEKEMEEACNEIDCCPN
jgi:hypothetical protein